MFELFMFYVFATVLALSAFIVILAKNPVHSALALVVAFFASAGLWLLLEAEFLALVLIVVYVGAVMTLFLFVVMMLDVDAVTERGGVVKYLPWGVLTITLIVAAIVNVTGPQHFGVTAFTPPAAAAANYSNVTQLGLVLYTKYVYPFELAAVLLLVAIVAAISLSLHKPRRRKQDITAQLQANPKDRVRLVKLPSEK